MNIARFLKTAFLKTPLAAVLKHPLPVLRKVKKHLQVIWTTLSP